MFDSEYTFNKYKGINEYTNREQTIPKAFSIIGVFFIIVGIIGLILSIYVILKSGTFDIKSILDLIVKNLK